MKMRMMIVKELSSTLTQNNNEFELMILYCHPTKRATTMIGKNKQSKKLNRSKVVTFRCTFFQQNMMEQFLS